MGHQEAAKTRRWLQQTKAVSKILKAVFGRPFFIALAPRPIQSISRGVCGYVVCSLRRPPEPRELESVSLKLKK